MKKLDENGNLVEAAEALFCTASSREMVAFLRSGFASIPVEQTNMQSGLLSFLYAVLINSTPERLGEPYGYLQCREKLPQIAAEQGLEVQGLLVLDEGAGHELYLVQPLSAQGGAFGRAPILVWVEHKTGIVLCENSSVLAERLREFTSTSSPESDGVV